MFEVEVLGIFVFAVEVDAWDSKQEQRPYGHGDSVGFWLVVVDEHHVEHADHRKEMFSPELVVAVVAGPRGG